MEDEKKSIGASCRTEVASYTQYRNRMHEIVDNVLSLTLNARIARNAGMMIRFRF
ncbi:MAG: hypothetical protein ACKVE4_10250 [Dissulfuribacterales bacterium]